MTHIEKEIFQKYEVRKSKKQRTAFIEYVKDFSQKHGYEAKVEKGAFGARNIVVGNPENAKVLYTAHYDTCARLFMPNFMTPKNLFVYILYQLVFVAAFIVAAIALTLPITLTLHLSGYAYDTFFNMTREISLIFYLLMLALMIFGPANKHTANDNTSGVITLLEIMESLETEKRNDVAFVFFDLEEAGLIGSSAFASKHKNVRNNTLVLNFDCVSDGDTIFFALKKTTKKYKDTLEKAFVSNDKHTVEVCDSFCFYPSDNASFKGGIGVSALKKTKVFNILYMDRIHTNKDTVFDETNIEFLKNGAIKLLNIL